MLVVAAGSATGEYGGEQGGGTCLEVLVGTANVVKAASVAWRTLTHDAERRFRELDGMVDGVRE